ncbi:ABC transporter ATP-binding protein [Niallia nealsonii]|uniref:Glycerol-3-phosphate ABC transporter ATP-binding protein n=1 Tax=Niallia nealsonii TaxID=115979 RepID=A0A2N0Z591_9BACI|nr:sn-glycerol-3-phosphate ABC transporter ATP-binding protein UgpC [Niallia nealsonii]PKG24673.1 glycerol-3-phosphate ABC transporter ATP-binding protein [Niallia nealsonii]
MMQVELKQIKKSYNQKTEVIKGIDVKIEPGEFFVLVGPSGCGKSTLLRLIAGLEKITSGDLLIGEQYGNDLEPSKRNLSMVFQNYALYPHLSVEENIMFGLHVKKISKEEQKERCYQVAEMLGIVHYLKRKPKELSGGQRQRVALARAIVTHAPICLMDEPLSNLDAKLRTKMRSEIRQLQKKLGITMIYVTHDQTEAMTMADRMMILNEGEVQQLGKPLDLYNNPANVFVASFIGSPAMNLMTVDILHSTFRNGNWFFPISHEMMDRIGDRTDVIFGVRPEHIHVTKKEEGYPVEVANVEILGTETLINFVIAEGIQWIARCAGQLPLSIGDTIYIYIKSEDVFLFDKKSEEILSRKKVSVPIASLEAVK